MAEYKEGMRLRSLKYPECGEATIHHWYGATGMWALQFDTPQLHHHDWPTHPCHGMLPNHDGRYFFADELDIWFEVVGPKIRKRTGFGQFIVDKSL